MLFTIWYCFMDFLLYGFLNYFMDFLTFLLAPHFLVFALTYKYSAKSMAANNKDSSRSRSESNRIGGSRLAEPGLAMSDLALSDRTHTLLSEAGQFQQWQGELTVQCAGTEGLSWAFWGKPVTLVERRQSRQLLGYEKVYYLLSALGYDCLYL